MSGIKHILVCTRDLFEGRKESVWYTLHRSNYKYQEKVRSNSFPCSNIGNVYVDMRLQYFIHTGFLSNIILHMYCACWTRLMKHILYRDIQYIYHENCSIVNLN